MTCTCFSGLLSRFLFTLLFACIALQPIALLAQRAKTGSIAGTIVDAQNGETIIGVNVIITGTTTGTTTDIDGFYALKGLTPGLYTLQFSYIGYNAMTVEDVGVDAGAVTRLDLQLAPDIILLEDVVVEARAIRNSEAVLLRDRQKAAAFSDAISAEAISRSGSSNAADAMEKVTGASVVGGKYVYVRGLGERYASTQLNGVELPSSDPDKKAVQFDIFPSNLLDNIVTIKTFTPDKPGNFSGGLVDIGTKAFPDALNVQMSASFAYNTQTTFRDDLLTYTGGKTDWQARDDGTRQLPSLLQNSDFQIPNPTRARFDSDLATSLDLASKSFNNVLAPTQATAPVNQSYALSIGNNARLLGHPLGYTVGVTYSNSTSYYEDGRTERWGFAGSQLGPDVLLDDARGTEEASMGLLANLTYRLGNHNEIGFNTVYTRNGESMTRLQQGQWEELDIDDPNSRFISRSLAYTERELYSFQLRGKHILPALNNTEIVWNGSIASTRQEEPDRRFVANTEIITATDTTRSLTSSAFRDPSRYYRGLEEVNDNASLDISVPFKAFGGLSAKAKFGGAYQYTDRTFSERIIEIATNPSIPFNGDLFAYFSPANMGITRADTLRSGRVRFGFGNTVRDATKAKNNYDGTRTIAAGYAMVELPLTSKLRFIGGGRLESTLMEVASQDALAATGKIDERDFLPSASFVYALKNNMNLRLAASRTLARPTFREVAPFESFDFLLGDFLIGNTDLKRSLITNYDVRWEWFMRPGEILSASLFYKNLQNPIERAIIGGANGQLRYQNVPEARVSGLEIEARSRLDRLASTLKKFSFGLNLSLVRSHIDIPGEYDTDGNLVAGELFLRRAFDPDASTRSLQGQSPYLLNADLGYHNNDSGTSASLYFNVFGDRLANVSLGGTPDVYQRASPELDLTVSQRLPMGWRVKLSAKNLLDSAFKESYELNGQAFIYQTYTRGRTLSLGFTYRPF